MLSQSWTGEMRRALDYDPRAASQEDNGEFWIDWRSLERFFDVLHINWDPSPYPHRKIVHHTWKQVKKRTGGGTKEYGKDIERRCHIC